MSASIYGINAVSKAEGRLGETIIILKCGFNYGAIYRLRDINRLAMADYPISIKVADEASNSTLKVEGLFAVFPFILKKYLQPLIEIGHLA